MSAAAAAASSTQSKRQQKPQHLTNLRYPYAKTWDKYSTYVEFEMANIHFSMANGIRRAILSQVKTVGFRTEPYKANLLLSSFSFKNTKVSL